MELDVSQISVWVCREEKLVLGISKRTTCLDVVKVLLQDQNSQHALSVDHSYCIVEKWRGFERILPNKTKILKLWMAWGEEQKNVKFVLVKTEASLAKHGARSAEARVVQSKQSPCVTKGSSQSTVGFISPEKQRRIVRKAFRKLEKMNKKKTRAAQKDASCAEKIETLVHLVVSQDHTIRQQIQRITELDGEIEICEAKVHYDRIKVHGTNYVQNTYLDATGAPNQDACALSCCQTLTKYEQYVKKMLRLQEELKEQDDLIDSITVQIQEELNLRWMQRRKDEMQNKQLESDPVPKAITENETEKNELFMEEERIKTQLDVSLYIGLRLSADLEAIRSDLDLSQQICTAREKEMRDLLEKVNSLDIEEGVGMEEKMMITLERRSGWVEQARGLSKAHNLNDDDSDTGLSSLHSQDSDSLPVWESLV